MLAPSDRINSVLAVNSTSGIVVLASHDNESSVDTINADYYFHNYIDLNAAGPTVTPNPPPGNAEPTRPE